MINNLDNLMGDTPILEGKVITADTIELLPKQVAWAAEASASAKPEARWQNYLDRLALIGIQEWLKNRVPELEIKHNWREPIYSLDVGDFKLFGIILDSIEEDFVRVSKAAIKNPELKPHLYVLVEVLAEPKLVSVCGCLSQLQLVRQQETEASRIEDEDDETYLLPLDWFELDPAQVLLYLRCIHPSALISQPSKDKTLVRTLLPSIPPVATNGISRISEKVEQVVQELSWILLPPLSLSSAVRSQFSKVQIFEIDAVEKELQHKGVSIPSTAIRMYQDFQWEGTELRLYAVKWGLATTQSAQEWSLLLILGASSNTGLPPKIVMKVKDETQNFDEEIVSEKSQDYYFYTQVIGSLQEKFQVTIQMPDETQKQFEPISFAPQSL